MNCKELYDLLYKEFYGRVNVMIRQSEKVKLL